MYDVVGLGSALMDLTIEVDDLLLKKLGLDKGTMCLVEEEKSREIMRELSGLPMTRTPGGSSANTVAGVACLGGRGVFIGKVGEDEYGDFYTRESEKVGVLTRLGRHSAMTGNAITLITPDSERTFAVHLGAALSISPDDVTEEDIGHSRILHLEGFLLELEMKKASMRALETAKANNVMISVDFSDPALIVRNLDEFRRIAREFVDVCFVNETEARALTGKNPEEALEELSRVCSIAVVKLGSGGSIIGASNRVHRIAPYSVEVVNTNGAGDMYAAGMLMGIARDLPVERSGKIASYAASRVVAQVGARLSGKLPLDQLGI